MSDDTDAYDALLDRVGRLTNVSNAREVLSWDQQVMMPDEGTPARSRQLSALSAVHHDQLTDDELGRLLEELSATDLDDDQAAVVREVRREQERAVRVPTDLVERISAASSEALPAWREAKETDDFETFAPHLAELIDLKRQYAEHVDPDRDPYEVLFEEYEPCLPLAHAEEVLTSLRDAVVPLVEEIRASDAELATEAFTAHGPFHVELHNVGGPIHVHLRLDDALSRAARLDGGNPYVESETVKRVPVGIVAGDCPVSGRLEIISGYGAETAQVAVTVAEDPDGGRAGTTATKRQRRPRDADAGGSDSPPTARDAGASSASRTSATTARWRSLAAATSARTPPHGSAICSS